MVKHVDPNLPVPNDFRGKGILENLPGGYRRDDNAAFQPISMKILASSG